MDIDYNIKKFISGEGKNKGRHPNERYASFDYCFNYFQQFRENNRIEDIANSQNLQLSCLQLAFYLASWGMLRGKSFLLEKSLRHYSNLIANISKFDKRIWEIDVDNYTEENIDLLLFCRDMISRSFGKENNTTDTLATKVMLGVFGNTPAFDDNFRKGFGVYQFNEKSLYKIAKFYSDNKKEIDKHEINTYDFLTGREIKRRYPKAKIIDMAGFIEGQIKKGIIK